MYYFCAPFNYLCKFSWKKNPMIIVKDLSIGSNKFHFIHCLLWHKKINKLFNWIELTWRHGCHFFSKCKSAYLNWKCYQNLCPRFFSSSRVLVGSLYKNLNVVIMYCLQIAAQRGIRNWSVTWAPATTRYSLKFNFRTHYTQKMRNFVVMDWALAHVAFFFRSSLFSSASRRAALFLLVRLMLSGYSADVKKCLAKGEQQFYLHSS